MRGCAGIDGDESDALIMKIQELRLDNFGKFTDRSIRIGDGVNILYGENESGKSTLHTFIKGMLFGMERGRGRASLHDTFSTYQPWKNPGYYSGALRFESGGKIFRIDRNFDKNAKKSELLCEDDGEQLSVEDGDLEVVLGDLNAGSYENTVSIGQLRIETGQPLAAEFKNYATNYYATGNSEIKLEKTFQYLDEKRKCLEREIKDSLADKQARRERMEQEASYVWRDVHRLEEEYSRITEEIRHRQETDEQEETENRRVIDELRPKKWRIHPVEIVVFIVIVVLAFILIAKPWNYLVSIIIFLTCGLYVWNRMKVGKRQEKTPPEIILEEITPKEEMIPMEKLLWERDHVGEELREKKTQYGNLKEQLDEFDEVSEDYREYDKRRLALRMAADKLNELSGELQKQLEDRLNGKASEILGCITDRKYTRLLIEDGLRMSVMSEGRKISLEKLSRGTVEQIYFALRMAASHVLHEEEYPVILDDTFVHYDDIRLANTLRWLYENRKQVIIFTCQKREARLLDEMGIMYQERYV